MILKKKNQIEPSSDLHEPSSFSTWFRSVWISPVDLAGESLDFLAYWRRSRRWQAVFALLPVFLVVVVLGAFVATGKLSTNESKVMWYANRANEELALVDSQKAESDVPEQPKNDSSAKRLPELIDMLFRRVLQLNKNNTIAKFYVANQMTRFGSRGSARQIMESLAPMTSNGYPKAHAWLAMDLIERGQKGESINIDALKYHLKRGTVGNDVSPSLLVVYSQLLQQENKTAESQEFLKRAAQFDPKLLLNSIETYNRNGYLVQASATADMLIEKVKDNAGNQEDNTVLAAQAYVLTSRLDKALEVLQVGLRRFPQSSKLGRALSDAFRLKFRATAGRVNNEVQVNLEFLNAAIALDPTNIAIQEELNALAQMGVGQNDGTIEKLRMQIAVQGTSFAARLLLAEASFRRDDVASAINDYEVVLAELPRMTLALNNLAMMLTKTVPARFDDALQTIDRAVAISPNVAEFHDSRGEILEALNRKADAVSSYLIALEKAPQRIQTRERLIVLYEELSQSEQAQQQRDKLADIQRAIDLQREKMKAAQEQSQKANEPPAPAQDPPAQDQPAQDSPASLQGESETVSSEPAIKK